MTEPRRRMFRRCGRVAATTLLTLVTLAPAAPASAQGVAFAVLPIARWVQTTVPATAFITMVNSNSTVARCSFFFVFGGIDQLILVGSGLEFEIRAVDDANHVVGPPDPVVDIPPGGQQRFLLTAMAPREVDYAIRPIATCTAGGTTALVVPLLDVSMLRLRVSSTPVPDMVALAATLGNDGIVDVSEPPGIGVFAVATVNLGAAGSVTVSAHTGGVVLPLTLLLCETDPASGACRAPMAPTLTVQVDAGQTPTFGVFVIGTDVVPFDPAANRIFVRFTDPQGRLLGGTGVAVRTR